MQKLKLKKTSAQSVRLHTWHAISVLPSEGHVVLYGQAAPGDPWVIALYGDAHKEIIPSCEHFIKGFESVGDVLGLRLEGRDLIVVSCSYCEDIKIIHPATGKSAVAFKFAEFKPAELGKGEGERLWVVHRNTKLVIELKWSSSKFVPTGKIVRPELGAAGCVYYIPSPTKALVFPNFAAKALHAYRAESGEKVWEVTGEVEGKSVRPHGVTVLPQHHLVLTSDTPHQRLLVLDPRDGSPLQSLPLPEELGAPQYVEPYSDDKLVMFSDFGQNHKILRFSLS